MTDIATEYDDGQAEAIADAIAAELEANGWAAPEGITVTNTTVEWAGDDTRERGRLQFSGISGSAGAEIVAATRARQDATTRTVAKSYQARSTGAQLRQLGRTKSGRQMLGELGVTARTIGRWLTGGKPSKANEARIRDTYTRAGEQAHERSRARGGGRTAEANEANHRVANAVTRAVETARSNQGRGQTIRFLNIGELHLDD